ncbi:MAG: metallopeptidase family protein [Elusimicrobia bacterium]|nr:metallopeptidase family protein [Elusimicrobiota bacterium]
MNLPRKEFDAIAERAFTGIPAAFREKLLNVDITVADRPGPEADGLEEDEELLGLYVGPTRQEIQSGMLAGDSPDQLQARVFLYKRPLEEACESRAELEREVVLTLRHELAHHFGFEDEDLEEFWPEGA